MIFHLVQERFVRKALPRVPEPDLVMQDPAKVESFMLAGREDGILAFTYVFNAWQTLPLIRPGDTVLDLACGPANQLGVIARLHPQAKFIGLDASHEMLAHAETTRLRQQLGNVDLLQGDMCRLEAFGDASIDVLFSSLSLHHLPDLESLNTCFKEMRRVLKPGGGVYLTDFGRLARHQTQEFFATDRAELQPELFTEDYRNSLRAAFSETELKAVLPILGESTAFHRTWLAPFMIALKSKARCEPDASTKQRARESLLALSADQQRDFHDYSRVFKYGGMPLPLSL